MNIEIPLGIELERKIVTREIKESIKKSNFAHFSIRDEIITNFDDYMHYMKKDGQVVCVDVNTLKRISLGQGKEFNILFGKLDAS